MPAEPSSTPQAAPSPNLLAQVQQQLIQLANQVEIIQAKVSQVAAAIEEDRSDLDALIAHLTNTAQQETPFADQLVEFTEQLSADHDQLVFLGRRLTELATQEQLVRLATMVATQKHVQEVAEAVRALERSQLRANELNESRSRQVSDLLTTMQAVLNRRQQLDEQTTLMAPADLEQVRRDGRSEFVHAFLPTLDAMEHVLDEGRLMLARHRQEITDATQQDARPGERPPSGNLVNRLRSRLGGEEGQDPSAATPHVDPNTAKALYGWLRSLALVRDRFLALMAQEGIEPIPTVRRRFDPRLHLAVQAEMTNDAPPDTILREVRRGFRQGARVLRYAEVIIARPPLGS